jgi:hypothetical protein
MDFSTFYPVFVLVTIIGTLLVLAIQKIPLRRLHEAETGIWRLFQLIAVGLPLIGAIGQVFFEIRPWGEPLIAWAFFPLGIWLWARCVYVSLFRAPARS